AALEDMNKELEAFSYSVSHDLRAPLRSINGYASILKEDYEKELPEAANKVLDNIIKSALRMSDLIDSLLTLSRLGRKDKSRRKINTRQLVERVVEDLKQENGPIKARIVIEELPEMEGDVELLKQVYVNLISNAVKYSSKKENPVVRIGAETDGGQPVYFVQDNGAGFNMEYKNKLFGVFQRLHGIREFEGIGIG